MALNWPSHVFRGATGRVRLRRIPATFMRSRFHVLVDGTGPVDLRRGRPAGPGRLPPGRRRQGEAGRAARCPIRQAPVRRQARERRFDGPHGLAPDRQGDRPRGRGRADQAPRPDGPRRDVRSPGVATLPGREVLAASSGHDRRAGTHPGPRLADDQGVADLDGLVPGRDARAGDVAQPPQGRAAVAPAARPARCSRRPDDLFGRGPEPSPTSFARLIRSWATS